MTGYFDWNATTPLHPAAEEAMREAHREAWQNPSSPYRSGARARNRLDDLRARVAALFAADNPERVVFTGGATEANNAVLLHLWRTLPAEATLVVSPIEHPCVYETARHLFGDRIAWAPLAAEGTIDLAWLTERLAGSGRPAAVSIMAANNETGIIQPWGAIAEACQHVGVTFHCDAVQAIGKVPATGLARADAAIGCAHKFGGPKGVGFIILADAFMGFCGQTGGEQELGRRGGTENIPAIAGMVAALEARMAQANDKAFVTERIAHRDAFEERLRARIPGLEIVGAGSQRLWNTTAAIMPGHRNTRWVAKLDRRGFQISTGSACATGKEGPSHVLAAHGYSTDQASRLLRISSGWETSEDDFKGLADALADVSDDLDASTTGTGTESSGPGTVISI